MKPKIPRVRILMPTTSTEHFKKIFSMLDKINDIPYTEREFKAWWIKNFNSRYFRVWVVTDEDEKDVYSFMVAQIVKPLIKDEVLIILTYIDPNSDVGHNLLDCVEGWARTLGIEKISAYIYRNPDGFCKKYNFKTGFREIFKELVY